nr:hypothetical protein [Tanacetum cinerariifolium]
MCINCTYGDGKPVTCCKCKGLLRGGFCLFCDLKDSFTNAYSFNNTSNNFNHLPQPQYENYLCELCGNNSHYGYDCQQQFPLVYEMEPSYNQNYNCNCYPHDSPSFLCCDNCGGSHETFQCQPMNQNIDSSSFDQIQTPQYHVIHHPSQEISEEVFQAKGDLMKSIQTFLEKFNCIPFGEKPKILLQAWDKFFAIQHAQPEDSNKYFQKLLEDLQIINKELAECNRPTFFNNNEDHYVQYKEYLENYSKEIAASSSNQEKEKPPQDFDIRQLITEECCIEVCKKQKQNMENTMLELVEKKQEVKNIMEQPTKRGTHIAKSLQYFRVVNKKSFISLNNTSQISPVHAIIPVLPIEEPEYSLSMGYEHLSTTPETESNEVTKSSAKNLVPIPSEYEVTSDDKSECEVPVKDDSSPVFTTFSNPLFNDNDDFTSSDDESLPDEDVPIEEFKVYSNPLFDDEEINSDKLDPHYFNVESDLIESLLNQDTLIDSSPKFDFLLKEFSGELAHINPILPRIKEADFDLEEEIHFVENLLYDNSSPRPSKELNAEITDTIVESLFPYHIPVKDSNSLMDESDLFLTTDELLPPNIESGCYDSKGDIHFLKELLIDDSIPFLKNDLSDFDHDNPSFPRPPPEPPDVEFFFDSKPNVIAEEISDELNEDECFDPGRFNPIMIKVSHVR